MAILRYIECCASTGQREAGCLEAIKKFPDIQVILDNRCSGTTIREAQSTASAMLDKLKDADGIFCSNEPSTLDMLLALKQNNLAGRKKFVGFDASPGLVEGLKRGEIQALVAQNPKKMGYEAVQGSPIGPIAAVGSAVFERYLSNPEVKMLAMGAGRTLRAVIDETAETNLPQLKILSITGSVSLDGSFNRFNAGLRAADRTGGKHFLLPVPLVAESPEAKKRWCSHELYRLVHDLYATADAAFIGIGHIAEACPLVQDGFVTRQEAIELAGQGAVADVLGWPVDRTGKLVECRLTERVTSMPLTTLATRPVIAFAGGAERIPAILAALRGHWISGLVTDQITAKTLLSL